MALIACKECGGQVSSRARACPGCGAKVPRAKWWLWIPLVLIGAFFLFGAMQPEYKTKARKMREACEMLIGNDFSRRGECDRLYQDELIRGRNAAEKR